MCYRFHNPTLWLSEYGGYGGAGATAAGGYPGYGGAGGAGGAGGYDQSSAGAYTQQAGAAGYGTQVRVKLFYFQKWYCL